MNKSVALFDLDGTLADNCHRQHFMAGGQKDWDGFFDAQSSDLPNLPIIALYQTLREAETFQVIVVTARPERYRTLTEEWFRAHGVSLDRMIMRADGDRRSDELIKREILNVLRSEGLNPLLVVDDRSKVVKMWREEGVTCLQCADHDF
jgi:FMN phosphatase YigB (HAD superfamily)